MNCHKAIVVITRRAMSSTICGAKALFSSCTIALKWAAFTFRDDKYKSIVINKGMSMNTTLFSKRTIWFYILHSFHLFQTSYTFRSNNWWINLWQKVFRWVGEKTYGWSEHHWYILLYRLPKTLVLTAFAYSSYPMALIYEVPISLVSKLEQKASIYIRKWLQLHKFVASLSVCSSVSSRPLAVRSLISVLKSSTISRHLLLKHSVDAWVSGCVPKLQAANWQLEEAVPACETDPKHKSIIEHHQHSPHGLIVIKTSKVPSDKSLRDYRHLFLAIAKKLRIHMPSPKQCSCKSRVNGLGGSTISNKRFLGNYYLQC